MSLCPGGFPSLVTESRFGGDFGFLDGFLADFKLGFFFGGGLFFGAGLTGAGFAFLPLLNSAMVQPEGKACCLKPIWTTSP